MKEIRENLITPQKYSCDVCVCGGGVAGIAAALAAKRAGADEVILLERGFMLGGLATAGLVTIYLALCDGRGHQVCFGLAAFEFHNFFLPGLFPDFYKFSCIALAQRTDKIHRQSQSRPCRWIIYSNNTKATILTGWTKQLAFHATTATYI